MNDALTVSCCPIAAVSAELRERYRALLSADEIQRLQGYRSISAANEFLIGRALLRTQLSARLQCAPQQLQFERDADGKPFLSNPAEPPYHFNLSHSHDWVVLAMNTGGAVGVDVELHERRNRLAAIAQRFFSERERCRLDSVDAQVWRQQFFAIWTLKEAHAKALGCGLAKILGCSSIDVDMTQRTIAMQLSDIAKPIVNISSWLFAPSDNCSLALVLHADAAATPSLWRTIPLQTTEALPMPLLACG